jgi:hypothetical protein
MADSYQDLHVLIDRIITTFGRLDPHGNGLMKREDFFGVFRRLDQMRGGAVDDLEMAMHCSGLCNKADGMINYINAIRSLFSSSTDYGSTQIALDLLENMLCAEGHEMKLEIPAQCASHTLACRKCDIMCHHECAVWICHSCDHTVCAGCVGDDQPHKKPELKREVSLQRERSCRRTSSNFKEILACSGQSSAYCSQSSDKEDKKHEEPTQDRSSTRVFMSCQQTPFVQQEMKRWLGAPAAEAGAHIRASIMPFNLKTQADGSMSYSMVDGTIGYDVPCYGGIPCAAVDLFGGPELTSLSKSMGIKIPASVLDKFVQGKVHKVKKLVEVARDLPECTEVDRKAADRLDGFLDAFAALTEVTCSAAWNDFVRPHVCVDDWAQKLHFDHLLSCFGFEPSFASTLRGHTVSNVVPKTGEVETATLEQYSLRWLGKMLNAYRPKGCMTDVVNLVFAMMSLGDAGQASSFSESHIIQTLKDFSQLLSQGDTSSLWVPTHFVHDAEGDDMLCWLLLQHITHSRMQVLIQLPCDQQVDAVAVKLGSMEHSTAIRDQESRNTRAILDYHK